MSQVILVVVVVTRSRTGPRPGRCVAVLVVWAARKGVRVAARELAARPDPGLDIDGECCTEK